MALVNIADGAAVGNHVAGKAPLAAQNIAEQSRIGAGGQAVDAVVGAHHGEGAPFFDSGCEMGQVTVAQVGFRDARVEDVAGGFRSAMNSVMLRRGHHLQVFGIVALQTANELDRHAGGEVWILAIGLHAAAPARIAEEVDVGSPEGQPLVNAALAAAHEFVVFGARFVGDGRGHAKHQVGIPGGGYADGFGKDGGAAGTCHAMQALVPPVVGWNAQAVDGRRSAQQLRSFLFEGHPREEIVHALFDGLGGVLVGLRGQWQAGNRQEKSRMYFRHGSYR